MKLHPDYEENLRRNWGLWWLALIAVTNVAMWIVVGPATLKGALCVAVLAIATCLAEALGRRHPHNGSPDQRSESPQYGS